MRASTTESNLQQFIDVLEFEFLNSTPAHRQELFNRPANEIKIFDFFASNEPALQKVKLIEYEITYEKVSKTSAKVKINQQKIEKPSPFNIDFSKQFNEPDYLKLASVFLLSGLISFLVWN